MFSSEQHLIELMRLLKVSTDAMQAIPETMAGLGESLPGVPTGPVTPEKIAYMHQQLDGALSTSVEVAQDYLEATEAVRAFVRDTLGTPEPGEVWTPPSDG